MYDTIQTALTYAIEAIASITFIGLPAHYIIMSHINEVKSWGTPHAAPAPEVKLEVKPEVKVEVQPEVKLEAEEATEVIPTTEAVDEVMKPRKICSKKMPQPKLQPLSVGAAVLNYSVLSSEQLRKQCALQSVNWRSGGDYGKPMKKAQMLAALK
jgi:hypothetical protein